MARRAANSGAKIARAHTVPDVGGSAGSQGKRAKVELVVPAGIGPAFARAFAYADRAVFGLGTELERSGYFAYDGDLPRFSTEVLGHNQWALQKSIQRALIKHRLVGVEGPRSCSKTHTAAEVVLGFMCTGPTTCYTTSGSGDQVKMGLWQKIRAMHASSRLPLPGEPSGSKWEIAPEWFAYGFSTKTAGHVQGIHSSRELAQDAEDERGAEARVDEALRGIKNHLRRAHRKRRRHRLLLIIDEAPEVAAEILHRLEGSLMAPNVYVLAFCNPTYDEDSDHPMARWMRRGPRAAGVPPFWRIHVAGEAFDAARWEPVPADECFHAVPDEIQSPEGRATLRGQGGIDNPYVRCFLYGLPASVESEFQIVPRRLLVACKLLELDLPKTAEGRHLGVDVAAQGSDASVAVLWVGGRVAAVHTWKHADTMATTGVVLELMVAWGVDGQAVPGANVHVDATGLGKGVVDRLRQLGHFVDGVDFGSAPRYARPGLTGTFKFRNLKTELHWTLRRGLEEQQFCIPDKHAQLWKEAQWPTFRYETRGKDTLFEMGESKDELREKFGKSPDFLDACVIGLARGGVGAGTITVLGDRGRGSLGTRLQELRRLRERR